MGYHVLSEHAGSPASRCPLKTTTQSPVLIQSEPGFGRTGRKTWKVWRSPAVAKSGFPFDPDQARQPAGRLGSVQGGDDQHERLPPCDAFLSFQFSRLLPRLP